MKFLEKLDLLRLVLNLRARGFLNTMPAIDVALLFDTMLDHTAHYQEADLAWALRVVFPNDPQT
jgi:hypothetical protein